MLCSFLCLFSSPLLLLLPLLLIPLLLGLLFGFSLFFFQPGRLPFPFFLFLSDFLPAFFFLLLFFLFHPSFSRFCSQFDLPGILLGSLFLSLGFLFCLLSLVGSSFLFCKSFLLSLLLFLLFLCFLGLFSFSLLFFLSSLSSLFLLSLGCFLSFSLPMFLCQLSFLFLLPSLFLFLCPLHLLCFSPC